MMILTRIFQYNLYLCKMKKLIIIIVLFFLIDTSIAQVSRAQVKTDIDTYIHTNGAKQITATQLNNILTELNSSAYNTITDGFPAATAWSITGNSSTTPNTNFLGTSDNKNLVFKINNEFSGLIDKVNLNTFFGYKSGSYTVTGIDNSAFGELTLTALSSGNFNCAFGQGVLHLTTTGRDNRGFGTGSLFSNTTGSFNNAFGLGLFHNTTGSHNIAIGYYALDKETTGSGNISIGDSSSLGSVAGTHNIAIGYHADIHGDLDNAIAIGANTTATQSNSLILGNGVNVGIGTTTPQASLQVNGLGTTSSTFGFNVNNSTGSNNALVVRDDGNVGFGTGTPSAVVHIVTSYSVNSGIQPQMILQNSNNTQLNNFSSIIFNSATTGGGILSTSAIYARRTARTIGSSTTQLEFYCFPSGTIGVTPNFVVSNAGNTFNSSLSIIDGSQGNGKVFTSDAGGLGTWTTPTTTSQTTVIAGNGISVSGAVPTFTVTNTSPNQIVALTGLGINSVISSYPNFSVTATEAQTLSISTNTITISGTNSKVTLPSTSGFFQSGGNSFGGNTSIGLNDNFNLAFKTNNTTRLTIDNTGLSTFTGQVNNSSNLGFNIPGNGTFFNDGVLPQIGNTDIGGFKIFEADNSSSIGLGTTGSHQLDFMGQITMDSKITNYTGINTVSNGVPSEFATIDLNNQGAAISNTTAYTPVFSGMYRISIYLQVTRAATTSSILGGETGVVITYNDADGNVEQSNTTALQSPTGTIVTTSATNTTATNLTGTMIVFARAGVAIKYAVGYTSVGGTSMQYSVHLKVEAM